MCWKCCKVTLYSSSYNWWNPLFKLSFKITFAPFKSYRSSYKVGITWITPLIAFIAWFISIRSLISSEFLFGTITTGDTYSLVYPTGSIIPASNKRFSLPSIHHEDETEHENTSEQLELQIDQQLISLLHISF